MTDLILTLIAIPTGIGAFVAVIRYEMNNAHGRPAKPWY
jgi:hypothetical protein